MCFSEFPQNFLYFIHQHLVVSPENSNVHLAYLFITQKKIMCFSHAAAAAAKPLQSCPTLCDPINGSSPGSPIPGILQAKILEWVAISFSMHESKKRKCSRSVVPDFATPWTAAYQAPPPMGFSRQEHWSGLPLPSPGTLLYKVGNQQGPTV